MDKKLKVYAITDANYTDTEFVYDNDKFQHLHLQKRDIFYKQEVLTIEAYNPDVVYIMSGWEVGTDYIYGQLFPLLEPWALRTGRPVIVQAPSFGPTNTILNGQYPWVTFETSTSFDINNTRSIMHNIKYNESIQHPPFPSKLFVCYNHRPDNYRTKMVDALAKHDLIKEGVVAYKRGTSTPADMLSFQYFKGPSPLQDPLEEDFELHSKPEYTPDSFPRSYHTGLVDIVTESRILEGEFQITEKTKKPLSAVKPFLVLGCSGYHQWLKETRHIEMYDEIFDYTFDSDTSVDARIEGICENIIRIRKEDPIKIMAKVKDKAEHNRNAYVKRIEDLNYSIPKSIRKLIVLHEYGRLEIKCAYDLATQDMRLYLQQWEYFSGNYTSSNQPWWNIKTPNYRVDSHLRHS